MALHIHDALQYLLLGGGEANVVTGRTQKNKGTWDNRIGMFRDELGRPIQKRRSGGRGVWAVYPIFGE